MAFNKLKQGNSPRAKFFTSTRFFKTLAFFSLSDVKSAFDFAYDMSFGKNGEHRDHRSGGTYERKPGEIFANTFQGKLCEFAIYEVLKNKLNQSLTTANQLLKSIITQRKNILDIS